MDGDVTLTWIACMLKEMVSGCPYIVIYIYDMMNKAFLKKHNSYWKLFIRKYLFGLL
jgi:hypothetical protein